MSTNRQTSVIAVVAFATILVSFAATSVVALRATVPSSLSSTSSSSAATCGEVIEAHYPQQYVAYKAANGSLPTLDGRLDEPFWEEVPFTNDFIDISTTTIPKFITKAKIRWDDDWVYVGGYIQETAVWANITYTCHCFNNSMDQVIFHDNDFEVFFDVDGTCHNYKEYEMNAANQNWDLILNAPYENGGYENSSRVFGKSGFDMVPPLHCATYTNGVLNVPSSGPTFWTVEIAFPIDKLVSRTTIDGTKPKDKQFWRINFSRVEWAVKIVNNRYWKEPSCQSCPQPGTPTCDNWVWSPMYVIDVHHPEMWGFLQFSTDTPNTTAPIHNIEWTPRYVAHELYYAQVAYFSVYGRYSTDVVELQPFANYNVTLNGECTLSIDIWTTTTKATATNSDVTETTTAASTVTADHHHYTALIASRTEPLAITITDGRYILAHYFNSSFTLEMLKKTLA